MTLFNQPLRAYIRTTVIVVTLGLAPQLAIAGTPHPSIREVARKEAVRMVTADSKSATVSRTGTYPPPLRLSTLNTNTSRRAYLVTLGALGGLVGGFMAGSAISCGRQGGEDCALGGVLAAPFGAAAAGISVAVLTR
jgi:hypothetical protein